jgi:translation initiation factor 1
MGDKPVYSTATGSQPRQERKGEAAAAWRPAAGPTKMRLETKGRGGKAVTVLFNMPFAEDEARRIMRELQSQVGCGATIKDGAIELQGDRRDRVDQYFAAKGLKITRAGG